MTTDPLDDLKAMMATATPTPDADKKADTLARAEKIFEDIQGSVAEPRLTSDHPKWTGVFKGVRHMFANLTSRSGLTATTALVAVGLVALVPVLRDAPPALDFSDAPEVVSPAPMDLVTVEEADKRATLSDRLEDDAAVLEVEEAPVFAAPEPVTVEPTAPRMIEPAMDSLAASGNAAPLGFIAEGGISVQREADAEAFANEDPSKVKIVSEDPVSTFSIDVDTASYSVVRSSIMNGFLPPADAVRIEEMVNYFPYEYAAPAPGEGPFKPTVSITPTPWNADTQLMHIAIQGEMPEIEDRPPLNLVFLIDTSGSMDQPNKLPLLKQSFRLMLGQLSDDDQVSIVTYAGSAGRVLDPTPASESGKIFAALDRLSAGGSTAGQQGLQQAYATAEEMAKDGEVTRVILATDGDFNVGIHDPEALKDFIADKRDSGTYLSVLGFGRGNLDDATMQALAQNGNGTAAYIDTLNEAQKVLVDQLTGALFPIANDVKIQVEFNPNVVAEYRLIGYETRALNREDFNNDAVDAGELGAGHAVTAIYEVTPVGSPAQLSDPLRYQPAQTPATSDELGFLRLRYKAPGADTSQLIETPFQQAGRPSTDAAFAAAIAGFGQLLRDDTYLGSWTYADAIALANANRGTDPFGYRTEAVQLMRLAQSLAN